MPARAPSPGRPRLGVPEGEHKVGLVLPGKLEFEGRPRWEQDLADEYGSSWSVMSSPDSSALAIWPVGRHGKPARQTVGPKIDEHQRDLANVRAGAGGSRCTRIGRSRQFQFGARWHPA